MHIVYLSASAELGGAERLLLDLIDGVRSLHPTWTLTVCAPEDGPLVTRVRQSDARVSVLRMPERMAALGESSATFASMIGCVPGALNYVRRLRAQLNHIPPDVVHSNGVKMHLAAAWTKAPQSRLVWHLHDYVTSRPRATRLMCQSVGACDAVIANSESVADDARTVFPPDTPLTAVLNGVDLTVFTAEGPALDLDALAGLPKARRGTIRVGLVATYAHWKGHDTFLHAIAALPEHVPVRGYVIGGPVYRTGGSQRTREELQMEAARLGISARVGFVGFVGQPAAAYRSLDVVVHASTQREPFGLVIAEALACGRAVIAVADGGAAEMLVSGQNSLAHPAGDSAGLARAIQTLASDAAMRGRLGRAGRRTAEHLLDRRRVASEVSRIYQQIAGRPQTLEPPAAHKVKATA